MRLFFIILNWKDSKSSIRCIESLLKYSIPYEDILLVDNSSNDGSVEHLNSVFPEITTIIAEANLGFAGGMNLGANSVMQYCNNDDAILFLNNDAIFSSDPYKILNAFMDTNVGLVSPLIVNEYNPNHFEFQGSSYDWDTPRIISYDQTTVNSRTSVGLIDSPRLSGAALAAKASTLRKIGLFDESLFMYFEDDDLSVRSTQAGFRNVVSTEVTVSHTGKSSKRAPAHYFFYMKRNEIYFWKKYLNKSIWRWYSLRLISEGFYNLSDRAYSAEIKSAIKDGLYSALMNRRGHWSLCNRPNWSWILFTLPKCTGHILSRLSSFVRRFS